MWLYGGQLATVILQFGYAAVTSRTLAAEQFGHYTIALAGSALMGIFAVAGLSQAAARLPSLAPQRVAGLQTYAVLSGVVAAIALALAAPAWATLWGEPAAAGIIRVAALGVLVSPTYALQLGLARRQGHFRGMAVRLLGASTIAMVIGAAVATTSHASWALLIAPVGGQLIGALLTAHLVGFGSLALGRLGNARHDLSFSGKVLGSNSISYLTGNLGKYSASLVGGAAVVGNWNRAEVITTVPLQQVQTSVIQALYPEFRHFVNRPDIAKPSWSRVLALLAWVLAPGGVIAFFALPPAASFLFGSGWDHVEYFARWFVVIGCAQILVTLVASALEGTAQFPAIWRGAATHLATVGLGVVGTLATGEIGTVVAAYLVGLLLQHAVHLLHLTRAGFVDGRLVLLRGYLGAALTGLIVWILGTSLTQVVEWRAAAALLGITVVAFVCIAAAWRFGRFLPPLRLAQELRRLSE
jgi:O-antigen/teichoic acid export membrane protein